jgi:hypothetical protein
MNKTKIYWAPFFALTEDWTILYKKPEVLFEKLKINIDDNLDKKNNLFLCPAVKNLASRTVIIKNPIETHYEMKDNRFIPTSKNYMGIKLHHQPSLKNCLLFEYCFHFIFFSEEDLSLTLTSPYFSDCPHLNYGSIVPGKFNISKWFRPIGFEFNLKENIKEFKIKEDEDMAYINFDSKNEIELIQFNMNEKLIKIAKSIKESPSWEKFVPFYKRYKRFAESNLSKIILNEINKNIV